MFDAMGESFFDELRIPGATFEGRPLPALFNWTAAELGLMATNPALMEKLRPIPTNP